MWRMCDRRFARGVKRYTKSGLSTLSRNQEDQEEVKDDHSSSDDEMCRLTQDISESGHECRPVAKDRHERYRCVCVDHRVEEKPLYVV